MPLPRPDYVPPASATPISALLRPISGGQVVQDVRPTMLAQTYPATAPMAWVDVTAVAPQPQPGDLTTDGRTFTRPNLP